MMKNLNDIAKSLYDGGWRWKDWIEFIDEYNFSPEELHKICSQLKLLEREDNND